MFMGMYEFQGDPDELLVAYDRMMAGLPTDGLSFHACVRREAGIVIYDCCPSEETFRAFSTSEGLLNAMTAAGLPTPAVAELGQVHVARSRDLLVTD
jgi:hypothetical protein